MVENQLLNRFVEHLFLIKSYNKFNKKSNYNLLINFDFQLENALNNNQTKINIYIGKQNNSRIMIFI